MGLEVAATFVEATESCPVYVGIKRGLGWPSRVQGYHTAHHSSFHRSEVKEASGKVTRRANTNTRPPQHPSRAEIWFSYFLFLVAVGLRACLWEFPPESLCIDPSSYTHEIITSTVVLSTIGTSIVIYTSSQAQLYIRIVRGTGATV